MKTSVKEHYIDVGISESELAMLVRLADWEGSDCDKLRDMLIEVRDSLDLDTPKKIRKILEAL